MAPRFKFRYVSPERRYERDGTFPLEMVHGNLGRQVNFNGQTIGLFSARYRVFNESQTCSKCGLEAKFYAKERSLGQKSQSQKFHLNMYGVDAAGHEILFTKDHILPRSRGGPDHLSNYRTMCEPCNTQRGNLMGDEETEEDNRRLNNKLQSQGGNRIHNPADPNSNRTRAKYIREEWKLCEYILEEAKRALISERLASPTDNSDESPTNL